MSGAVGTFLPLATSHLPQRRHIEVSCFSFRHCLALVGIRLIKCVIADIAGRWCRPFRNRCGMQARLLACIGWCVFGTAYCARSVLAQVRFKTGDLEGAVANQVLLCIMGSAAAEALHVRRNERWS